MQHNDHAEAYSKKQIAGQDDEQPLSECESPVNRYGWLKERCEWILEHDSAK